ncbi:AAA family ATPase [uncultured Shimia sp.]|uniref:AAA family ATPase n=1 Tax=uncultured Shimia sp. TaxID=573152 RepID=UPI0025EE1413|nr:AAA family ATPase [uncultured Shimia sp.]
MVHFPTCLKEIMTMNTTPSQFQLLPNPTITKAGEFRPKLNVPFIVKDLFKPGEVAMIAGAPGLGKSSIMAAGAAHAAQGRDFGGLPVKNAVVIYYAAEDAYGVLCRAHPYMQDPACANAPFYVVHGAPNLLDPEAPEKVAQFVAAKKIEHRCDQALVVFDTLNRCIGEADENSSSAMGTVVGNAAYIAQSANASVVFLHHVGNGNADRPRGSSAFHGNVDSLCLLSKAPEAGPSKVVLLNAVKQKNAQELGPLPFRLDSFKIGTDSEGSAVTVPMAVPMEPNSFAKPKEPSNENRKPAPKTEERRADIERVLFELGNTEPGSFFQPTEIAARSGSAFNEVRNSDSLRVAVRRALEALEKAGKAEKGAKGYRLAQEVTTSGGAGSA